MTFVATFLLLSSVDYAYTQSSLPEESRPYLELPFPGETTYEVTCGYGCYQHQGSMSYAVDFAVPEGDPILAAAAGTVKDVTWERGLPAHLDLGDALILYLDHGNGWFTRYVHLEGITVEVDERVEMGDVIGYGGKTGASGAHLHFELKYGISLHSASVPINELFDGKAPEAGKRYVSNNWTLANKALSEQSLAEAQEILQAERNPDLNNTDEATDALPIEEESAAQDAINTERQAVEEVILEPDVDEEREGEASLEVILEPTVDREEHEEKEEVVVEPHQEKEEALQEEEEPLQEAKVEASEEGEGGLIERVDIKNIDLQSTEHEVSEEQLAALDSPAPIAEQKPQEPYIETELTLSAPSISVLTPITATFSLRNGSSERLHLATLGVVARRKGETTLINRTLFFERSIVLNPGRSYDFQQQHTLKQTGDFELFIFAFDADNKLITLQGAEQIVPLQVERLPNTIYLPLVKGSE